MTKITLKQIAIPYALFLLAGIGISKAIAQSPPPPPPAPTVMVTAGDPGDLDCGDVATAPATASLDNPPTGKDEATLTQHWTWSIDVGDSSTVYVDHPDASTTTYHCEHDDPGDYTVTVTASVTLHDPATGTDYGPFSGSDTFGDIDVEPSTAVAASTSGMVASGSKAAPQGTAKTKQYPVRLHFTAINPSGVPFRNEVLVANYSYQGRTWRYGHRTYYNLEYVLKGNKPFTKGMGQEQFNNPQHNHKYFSVSGPQTYPEVLILGIGDPEVPLPHPNGFFTDLNQSYSNKDTEQAPYKDSYWYDFGQYFVNTGPNGKSDNTFHLVCSQGITKRF